MAIIFPDKVIESGPVLFFKRGGECYMCPSKEGYFELKSASAGRHIVLTLCKTCVKQLLATQINWETEEIKR